MSETDRDIPAETLRVLGKSNTGITSAPTA